MSEYRIVRDQRVLSEYARVFPNCEALDLESVGWAVKYGDESVGFATCLTRGWNWCFLNSAYVHPNHRGRGLQTRLIRTRVKFANSLGLIPITYVHPKNIASLNNLIKCGFRFYEPSYAWAGSEFLYLRKIR